MDNPHAFATPKDVRKLARDGKIAIIAMAVITVLAIIVQRLVL